jgi:glutaconate CoA-transferase, subunit A
MIGKVVSMKEAIQDSVQDGQSIFIEGFTHLICFAAGHEIMRQKKKNLVGIRLTPDLIYDQMMQAGCINKLIFGWAGNPGVGSLHAFRRLYEKEKKLEIEEYSHFGMVSRILAGAAGLPFWPLNNYQGTDIPTYNKNIKEVTCPFTNKKLAAVPPIHPDVCILHCQRADKEGNAQAWGLFGTQKESAMAAKTVIVVAEEIVDASIIRADPNRTIIPGFIVKHVVHEPFGCHPSFVQGYHDRDNDFYVQWDEISRDPKTYDQWLGEFVFGVKDRAEYAKKMGSSLMQKLKAKPRRCEGVDYGF